MTEKAKVINVRQAVCFFLVFVILLLGVVFQKTYSTTAQYRPFLDWIKLEYLSQTTSSLLASSITNFQIKIAESKSKIIDYDKTNYELQKLKRGQVELIQKRRAFFHAALEDDPASFDYASYAEKTKEFSRKDTELSEKYNMLKVKVGL